MKSIYKNQVIVNDVYHNNVTFEILNPDGKTLLHGILYGIVDLAYINADNFAGLELDIINHIRKLFE